MPTRSELRAFLGAREWDTVGAVTDALLARWPHIAGPRRSETPEDAEALPLGTIVRSASGTIAARFDQTRGVVFGDDRPFSWSKLALPLTILFIPDAEEAL